MGKVHPPLLWLCFPRQSVRAITHSGLRHEGNAFPTVPRPRLVATPQDCCSFRPLKAKTSLWPSCVVLSPSKNTQKLQQSIGLSRREPFFWRSAAFFSNDLEWGCFNLQMAGICNPWLLLMGLEMFSCIRGAGSRPLSYVMFSLRPALLISCCLCMQLGLNQLLRACLHGRAKVFTHGWLRAKKKQKTTSHLMKPTFGFMPSLRYRLKPSGCGKHLTQTLDR